MMGRLLPSLLIAATALAGTPVLAAQNGAASPRDVASGPDVQAPSPLSREQVRNVQQLLNKAGFSSGYVDGLWGPVTATALANFQRRRGLPPDGNLTAETMRALVAPAVVAEQPPKPAAEQQAPSPVATAEPPKAAVVTSAIAAPQPPVREAPAPATGMGVVAAPVPVPVPATVPPTQAANADQALEGANSFTEEQARGRIESNGFSNVGDLQKDSDGVWRGKAAKDGRQTGVWLDYKGNVGQF